MLYKVAQDKLLSAATTFNFFTSNTLMSVVLAQNEQHCISDMKNVSQSNTAAQ